MVFVACSTTDRQRDARRVQFNSIAISVNSRFVSEFGDFGEAPFEYHIQICMLYFCGFSSFSTHSTEESVSSAVTDVTESMRMRE